MSIHQPRSDIFHTFDKLMVLAEGRLVINYFYFQTQKTNQKFIFFFFFSTFSYCPIKIYFGKTQQAKYHFESLGYQCPPDFNPADFICNI